MDKTRFPAPGPGFLSISLFRGWFINRNLLPWVVLAISLATTYQSWTRAKRDTAKNIQDYFEFRVRDSISRIEQRMQTYEQVLRGARGLFEASISVQRDEWRSYVAALKLEDNYPGIQGVGFSFIVSPSEKEKHTASIRKEGFPEYTIRPEGDREIYTSIIYLEPFFGRNLRAFGYDMYSEPVRRAAMEEARDLAKLTISGKVRLVQEAEKKEQAGFLMYLPVYRNKTPRETIADRRANIIGWVYSPFRMDDLMLGIQGERASDLDIEIYDGDEISEKTLMHDADGHRFAQEPPSSSLIQSTNRIRTGGRYWTVLVRALHPITSRVDAEQPRYIAIVGIAASLLLTLVTWLLAHGRMLAIRSAQEMNRELIESEAKLKAAEEIGNYGSLTVNLLDDKAPHFWSDGFYKIIGLSPGEIEPTPENYLKFVHSDDIEKVALAQKKALGDETGGELSSGYRVVRKDGTERFIQSTIHIGRDDNGKPVHIIGTMQDITELKQAEEALRKAKNDAENATQLKDKFISLVSHDLRGPLSAMLGLLNLARRPEQRRDDAKVLEIMNYAISSGDKMLNLIEDLLGVSRFKTGMVRVRMTFANPHFVVDNAISILRVAAERKRIEIVNDIQLIGRIYADPFILEEVIRNFLSNAIKFSGPGGKVTVSMLPDRPFTIAVADNGVGIPPEMLEKLFSYEEKTTTRGTADETGTGLGLPLCRDMMESMGGKIWVESSVGKGSVFYAGLPYKRPAILVVDDDPAQVMVVKNILQSVEVDFMAAQSGQEALNIIEANPPHLIICDVIMPGMDGYELVDKIRQTPASASVPIIMMTSHAGAETRNLFFAKGVSDFIAKPFTVDELITRVRRFIW